MAHHSRDAATGFAAVATQAAEVWKTIAGHTSLSTAPVTNFIRTTTWCYSFRRTMDLNFIAVLPIDRDS